jgi:hypothetical protein
MNIFRKINIKILLITSIILKLLDVGLTIYIVDKWGIDAESNPLVRYMINIIGVIPTMIDITLAYTCVMLFLYIKEKKGLLLIANVLMILIVMTNLFATVIQ